MPQLKIYSTTRKSFLSIKLNRIERFCPRDIFSAIIKIKDQGFAGENSAIPVTFKQWSSFLEQLKSCDEQRRGKAILIGDCSVNKFELAIESFDDSGHFSLSYLLAKREYLNSGRFVTYQVNGEFELDSSCFTQMIKELNSLIPDLAEIIKRYEEWKQLN